MSCKSEVWKMTKSELRNMMKRRRRTLSATRILCYSAIVTEKLLKEDVYRDADVILGYYSISAEVSMDYLFEQARKDGKKVALPVCLPGREMEFRYFDENTELVKGEYGIPEPVGTERVELDGVNALVVVPGVSFDAFGNRIGYGGGYYDRFLKKYPDIPKVMLAYELQKTISVPADGNDIPMNLILTETDRYAVNA
ncbi:MAG: 5-formyltetrahydrofolate cyclo-ligase [Lachnospiraceae bacterium]|nr:5-formyltetrahydrofolate cyclo-ligase [Lachnospiraceae bacterium]